MCNKCGNSSCGGGCNSNSMSSMQDQINTLSGFVDDLVNVTRFLKGHPILEVNDSSDIAQFDLITGKGTGDWTGWGICNGNTYTGALGNIISPDMRDKFLVGALGNYAVGDQGGADTVTLGITQIPSHTHTVNDPGHTHIIIDPGHDHPVDDPGHTHAGTSTPHTHTFTTGVESNGHTHSYDQWDLGGSTYDGPTSPVVSPSYDFQISTVQTGDRSASHTHSGTTNTTSVTVAISTSFTGIIIDDALTGVTNTPNTTGITIGSTGGGLPHENRPPYFALIFVQKIF